MAEFYTVNAFYNKNYFAILTLKMRPDLECSSLAFNIHTQCANTKGTKLRSLEVFSFRRSYSTFLKDASLWKAVPKHSRSNLVFDLRNILFSECFIKVWRNWLTLLAKHCFRSNCNVLWLSVANDKEINNTFWQAMFRWLVSQRLFLVYSYSKSRHKKIVCVHDALESKQHAVISVIPHDLYLFPVEKFSLTGRNRN